jgi:sRNA-binding regulator protein Hfq
MLTSNSKILEFFAQIPKLETDGHNWVIFKDHFLYTVAAASLIAHVDGMGVMPLLITIGPGMLTAKQQKKFDKYELALSKWKSNEAIIKQAIATVIQDSLFIEVRKKEMAYLM